MQNIYLELDGIKGESTSDQGKDMIEVLSWNHGVSMPMSAGNPSGASVKHGRCDHQDITISKYLDISTPTLNLNCSAGVNIKKATLHMWQADADAKPVEYYTVTLTDVLISSISIGASGTDKPVETLTLHYNMIEWTYNLQTKDAPGGSKGKAASGWNLEANKKK